MGQTVGKPVDRLNKKAIIEQLHHLEENELYINPLEYIHKRFEARESIGEWGFLWAHRILEEVFVRPELDMKWILSTLHKEDLASIVPESEIDQVSLSTDNLGKDKLNELHQILTANKAKQDEATNDDDFLLERMNGMMFLAKKMWRAVLYYVFGASAIDVLVESDVYFEIMQELDSKIKRLKKDIANQLFQK